ncbi:MAG: peptidoglycan recognition family protein [Phormidesmis sp.]
MRHSWLVWATSTVAFLFIALALVISGSAQKPAQGKQSLVGADGVSNAGINNVLRQPRSFTKRFQSRGVDSYTGNLPASNLTKSAPAYQPPERVYLAHPSNYGERFPVDANGNTLSNQYIVVLHETVGSASSALNTFQTNHPNDNDQVSYHTLVGLDGTVYYVVPPEQRAFGAGNSVFRTSTGEESVFTNPDFPSSVNNFAYHISLETPPDGQNNNNQVHSGYTEAQYQSLAWLLARTTVPNDRITTHKAVDRSGSRSDPRSFDPQRLINLLSQYPSREGL